MRTHAAIAAALFVLARAAACGGQGSGSAGGPVPVPYPNTTTSASAPRRERPPDGSGLPSRGNARARKINLADGRTFVLNAETGEVVFGDGVQGKRPETGNVPMDGKYRLGGGAAGNVEVRSGRIVTPTPTPTPAR